MQFRKRLRQSCSMPDKCVKFGTGNGGFSQKVRLTGGAKKRPLPAVRHESANGRAAAAVPLIERDFA
jgi:hypothetical protein